MMLNLLSRRHILLICLQTLDSKAFTPLPCSLFISSCPSESRVKQHGVREKSGICFWYSKKIARSHTSSCFIFSILSSSSTTWCISACISFNRLRVNKLSLYAVKKHSRCIFSRYYLTPLKFNGTRKRLPLREEILGPNDRRRPVVLPTIH